MPLGAPSNNFLVVSSCSSSVSQWSDAHFPYPRPRPAPNTLELRSVFSGQSSEIGSDFRPNFRTKTFVDQNGTRIRIRTRHRAKFVGPRLEQMFHIETISEEALKDLRIITNDRMYIIPIQRCFGCSREETPCFARLDGVVPRILQTLWKGTIGRSLNRRSYPIHGNLHLCSRDRSEFSVKNRARDGKVLRLTNKIQW